MTSHAHHARHASPRRRHPVMVGAAAGSAVTAVAGGALAGSVPAAAPVALTAFPAVAQAPSAIPAAAHPQLASAGPAQYAVQPGDTLSAIAAAHGFGTDWSALWASNFGAVPDPDAIVPGMKLSLSWGQLTPGMKAELARLAAPRPSSPPPAQAPAPAPAQSSAPSGGAVTASDSRLDGPWPGGAFGNCVVERESGGSPQVMNSSGHYGLYQFSASTWAAHGGSPADFGHASAAEQEQVFENTVAADGTSDWQPYDGCS